jgi:hypothetical protein
MMLMIIFLQIIGNIKILCIKGLSNHLEGNLINVLVALEGIKRFSRSNFNNMIFSVYNTVLVE